MKVLEIITYVLDWTLTFLCIISIGCMTYCYVRLGTPTEYHVFITCICIFILLVGLISYYAKYIGRLVKAMQKENDERDIENMKGFCTLVKTLNNNNLDLTERAYTDIRKKLDTLLSLNQMALTPEAREKKK